MWVSAKCEQINYPYEMYPYQMYVGQINEMKWNKKNWELVSMYYQIKQI